MRNEGPTEARAATAEAWAEAHPKTIAESMRDRGFEDLAEEWLYNEETETENPGEYHAELQARWNDEWADMPDEFADEVRADLARLAQLIKEDEAG